MEPSDNLPAAPKSKLGLMPAPLGGGLGTRLVWTSLPQDTLEGRAKIARAVTADLEILWDLAPVQVLVTDLVVLEAEVADQETGEVTMKTRTCLIQPDGTVLTTTSPSFLSRLQRIAAILGPPPWLPARRLEVYRAKTRGGQICLAVTIPLMDGKQQSES